MNPPRTPEQANNINHKLVVRSEVLAVIQHFISLEDPPKEEKVKQVKRLYDLNEPEYIQDVLVKELIRSKTEVTLHVVTELLMEFGAIDYLQQKLWDVIRDPKTSDEVKDAANLVLRHLGDPSDPDLYLEYLKDPKGLIGRETIRMLEISTENPETLIDFIDFILSLKDEDQARLIASLHEDYPTEYLVELYVPLLESDPPTPLWEQLVENLGESRSPKSVQCLLWANDWPEDRLPVAKKQIQHALKKLQLAGVYHPETDPPVKLPEKTRHMIAEQSIPYQCFATISDGIGNQGILFSRQRNNGDIAMVCMALNDLHGVIDSFGFYQISVGDYHRIAEKFHEGATKIKVTPEYCAYKVEAALQLNRKNFFRIPYEFQCWRPMMQDVEAAYPENMQNYAEWTRSEWTGETGNLYQHPDFNSWFLEKGDDPTVTESLQEVDTIVDAFLVDKKLGEAEFAVSLEAIAEKMMRQLLDGSWRQLIQHRLIEAAYLLDCQNTHTFRSLAATEAHKLETATNPEQLLTGFVIAYGRRCITEELLRLKTNTAELSGLEPVIESLLQRWGLDI